MNHRKDKTLKAVEDDLAKIRPAFSNWEIARINHAIKSMRAKDLDVVLILLMRIQKRW